MLRSIATFVMTIGLCVPLMGFRMPSSAEQKDALLYDIRGAFVTARPDVPQGLIIATDMLVDEAIRTTVRMTMLPRAIISVRIDALGSHGVLFGNRHEAKVTVKAIAVATGEPVAEGSFKISAFVINGRAFERELAQGIAARIASEFRLDPKQRPSLATALFP